MVDFQSDSFPSSTTSRVRHKSTSNIFVTIVKRDDIINSAGNSIIKFPISILNEVTNTLPVFKLLSSGGVNVFRIKSTKKPRPHSMDLNLQKTNKVGSVEEPISTCRSARDVKIVRVSSWLRKPA